MDFPRNANSVFMKTLVANPESSPRPARRLRAVLSHDLVMRLAAGFGVGIATRVAILVMEIVIGKT